jgi:hypothetical protein
MDYANYKEALKIVDYDSDENEDEELDSYVLRTSESSVGGDEETTRKSKGKRFNEYRDGDEIKRPSKRVKKENVDDVYRAVAAIENLKRNVEQCERRLIHYANKTEELDREDALFCIACSKMMIEMNDGISFLNSKMTFVSPLSVPSVVAVDRKDEPKTNCEKTNFENSKDDPKKEIEPKFVEIPKTKVSFRNENGSYHRKKMERTKRDRGSQNSHVYPEPPNYHRYGYENESNYREKSRDKNFLCDASYTTFDRYVPSEYRNEQKEEEKTSSEHMGVLKDGNRHENHRKQRIKPFYPYQQQQQQQQQQYQQYHSRLYENNSTNYDHFW